MSFCCLGGISAGAASTWERAKGLQDWWADFKNRVDGYFESREQDRYAPLERCLQVPGGPRVPFDLYVSLIDAAKRTEDHGVHKLVTRYHYGEKRKTLSLNGSCRKSSLPTPVRPDTARPVPRRNSWSNDGSKVSPLLQNSVRQRAPSPTTPVARTPGQIDQEVNSEPLVPCGINPRVHSPKPAHLVANQCNRGENRKPLVLDCIIPRAVSPRSLANEQSADSGEPKKPKLLLHCIESRSHSPTQEEEKHFGCISTESSKIEEEEDESGAALTESGEPEDLEDIEFSRQISPPTRHKSLKFDTSTSSSDASPCSTVCTASSLPLQNYHARVTCDSSSNSFTSASGNA